MLSEFKKSNGSSMIICLLVLMVIIAMGGLLLDGGRALLAYNQLFHSTYIAAHANLGSYDRELWLSEGRVELDFELAEKCITEVLDYNMPGAQIVYMKATSENSMKIRTKYEVQLSIFSELLNESTKSVGSEAQTFIID